MRLIDADALRKYFEVPHELKCGIQAGMDEYALKCIDEQPTIDAVPVRHGEWIIDGAFTYNLENDGKAYEPVYRCSCCHRQTESYLRLDEPKMPEDADFPEFCPHCGARMDGGKDDNQRNAR